MAGAGVGGLVAVSKTGGSLLPLAMDTGWSFSDRPLCKPESAVADACPMLSL